MVGIVLVAKFVGNHHPHPSPSSLSNDTATPAPEHDMGKSNSTTVTTGNGTETGGLNMGNSSVTLNETVWDGKSHSVMHLEGSNWNATGMEMQIDVDPSTDTNDVGLGPVARDQNGDGSVVEYAKISNETMQDLKKFNFTEIELRQGQKFGIKIVADLERWRKYPFGVRDYLETHMFREYLFHHCIDSTT